MGSRSAFPSRGCVSGEGELCENGLGLDWDVIDGDVLSPPIEPSEQDQEELPVGVQCMMPTSVREYTKGKGRGKERAHEEKGPLSSMVNFRYWQDEQPLCRDICILFNNFIASFLHWGPAALLGLQLMAQYELMPAYDCPFPNFGDPQFGICNWMWQVYEDQFADVEVPEEVRGILGDSPAAVLTMMFFAFVRTTCGDIGGWNNALQKPPEQEEPISKVHTDGVSTGHRKTGASSSDDYSIGCLSPTPAFLGLHGCSEFGSQIHNSCEASRGRHTQRGYARAPDYSSLGPFRLPKNSNRPTGPHTTEAQQLLSSHGERAEREGQCSPECPTYDPWNVSNKAKKPMRSISAPPGSRPSGGDLSSGPWPSVSGSAREVQIKQSAFFQGSSDTCRAVESGPAEELSLSSGSIYEALGGIGYNATRSLPGRAPESSAQGSGAMRGQLKNNNLPILIKNGKQSIHSCCTSFHTAVTPSGPLETQHGLLRFRMEQGGSSARVIEDSELRFESGQSLRNVRLQAGAYIEPDKCAICYEDWVWERPPEVARFRDDRKWELARLPCGHCFHGDCLAIWFSQISLTKVWSWPLLTLPHGRCDCPYCRRRYLSWEYPWVNPLVREGDDLRGYPNRCVSGVLGTENIPNVAPTGENSERPMNSSYMRSDVSGGRLNSIGSGVVRSSAGWSTVTENTQLTVLRRRRRGSQRQSNGYITNDSLELSHPGGFSSLGSFQLIAPPNADSFEDEYWERYSREIGEGGGDGWGDLGQLGDEGGIFGGSVNTAWPHMGAYINAGVRSEHFYPASPLPISGGEVVKSAAPPRLRALLCAAELLESVSSDLTPASPNHLSLLDSTIYILNQFIREHREVYREEPRGYTNNSSAGRSRSTSTSDLENFFPEVGSQTKQKSGNHRLRRYTNTQAITKGSGIPKPRAPSAEDTDAGSLTSRIAVPGSVALARGEQARRRGQFGSLYKRPLFSIDVPGSAEFIDSRVGSGNTGLIFDGTAVPLAPSLDDIKPKDTAPGESALNSSDEQFSMMVVPPVTKTGLPFSPDVGDPRSQEVGVRRINHKGSKIPVLAKKAGVHRDTPGGLWGMVTPIPWNRENSPFKSEMSVSSLRRRLFADESIEERDGSPTVRQIGSRSSNESMC
ncbi:hypothetical protein HOY82DRAFT_590136 [Tuber indicum]|nr:hypothetical protein HOY82DRAFT_590136 [Tuber indicum]